MVDAACIDSAAPALCRLQHHARVALLARHAPQCMMLNHRSNHAGGSPAARRAMDGPSRRAAPARVTPDRLLCIGYYGSLLPAR